MACILRNQRAFLRLITAATRVTQVKSQIQAPQLISSVWQADQVRMFSDKSGKLINILAEELKHEKETYEKPDNLSSGPPAPFILQEKEVDTLLTLKRTYNNEEIEVNIKVNDQPEPEQVEDGEGNTNLEINVIFTVSVTKGDQSLILDIRIFGDQFVIDHAALEPKEGYPSDSYYTGPVFEELDEDMVTGFYDFLEERGINTELANYLVSLVHDKEQREYQSWLSKVRDFLSK